MVRLRDYQSAAYVACVAMDINRVIHYRAECTAVRTLDPPHGQLSSPYFILFLRLSMCFTDLVFRHIRSRFLPYHYFQLFGFHICGISFLFCCCISLQMLKS